MPSLQDAFQKHHDYYVRLFLEGRLTEADKPQYELAMQRERDGLVRPLVVRKTPGVVGGSACIRDTRIAVWMLVRCRQLGVTDDQLQSRFVVPLEQSDLDAAWAYYETHREEIEQEISENDKL